jgi:hypothetical protein
MRRAATDAGTRRLNARSAGRHCRHGEETRTFEACPLERLQDRQQSRMAGEVEAPDESAAMEKAAAAYKVPPTRLMAVRR